MGILDDAIREHLDLKRQHGAGDGEVKSLEDEAFGGGDRPDPFAAGELFGEVATPSAEPGTGSEEIPGPATPPPGPDSGPSEEPTRLVEPTAEPPEGPPSGERLESPTAQAPPPPPAEAPAAEAPEIEAPPPPPEPEPAPPEPPASEPPAESASLEDLMAEDDSTEMAAPPPPPPPDTAEAARPGGETAAPPPPEPEAELPPRELVGESEPEEDEPVAEAEPEVAPEPEAVPPPPPPPPPESGPEPPGRARGRVNVPTQEFTPPPAGTDERDELDAALVEEAPEGEASPAEEPVSEVYDFAIDEEPFGEASAANEAAPADSDDFEALGPVTDGPVEEVAHDDDDFESEGYTDEHTAERGPARDPDDTGDFDPSTAVRDPDSEEFDSPAPVPHTDEHDAAEKEGDDILSGSPDFVEEGEDEDLWFEKGPPKDFDFEDEEK